MIDANADKPANTVEKMGWVESHCKALEAVTDRLFEQRNRIRMLADRMYGDFDSVEAPPALEAAVSAGGLTQYIDTRVEQLGEVVNQLQNEIDRLASL